MRNKIYLFLITTTLFGCLENVFLSDEDVFPKNSAPSDLVYPETINAREFSQVITGTPSINAGDYDLTYEILAVRGPDGNPISVTDLEDFISIESSVNDTVKWSPDLGYPDGEGGTVTYAAGKSPRNAGRITIADGNPFSMGTYTFDIKVSNGTKETVFNNALELYLGPQLPSGIIYVPAGQNLLLGQSGFTTEPIIVGGNPDIRIELADNTDKLTMDATGKISIAPGYTTALEPEIISPAINVINNISGEVVTFTNTINVYISTNPVDIPKVIVPIFRPTMKSNNLTEGIRLESIVNPDGLNWAFSTGVLPSPGPDERPAV